MRLLLIAIAVWLTPAVTSATNYYVKPGGDDLNSGTSVASAFQTIQRAANLAQAGDSVLVLPGNYQGFNIKNSGTSDSNRLVYKSTTKWGAVINAPISASWPDFVNINSKNYVTIDGFTITGSLNRGIGMFNTVGLHVRNCYITECHAGAQGAQNGETLYEDNVFDDNGDPPKAHMLYFAAGDCPAVTPPMKGIVVRHNIFRNSRVGSGSALHFVSHKPGYKHEVTIENNIFAWNRGIESDITAMSVRNSDIRNNVFFTNNTTNGVVQISSVENWCDATPMDSADSVRVYNNTIYAPHTKGIYLRQIDAYGTFDGKGFVIFNNLVIAPTASEGIVNNSTSAQSIANNIVHGMDEPGIATILGNLFVDWQNDDYRIRAGSEAHNAGIAGLDNIEAPLYDLDGTQRPLGGVFDVGAYEVIEGTQAPPAPPQNVAASETSPGCIAATWRSNSEPDVTGYVVYYGQQSVASGAAASYASSIDVGSATTGQACGLSTGTWYLAVRAYNATGDFSGYSAERTISVAGPDVIAPSVVLLSPADGAVGIPGDASIGFSLTDNSSGVDTNSVTVTINGVAAAAISYTGTPARFDAVCVPASALPPNATVTVVVSVADRASPPNTGGRTWTFTTASVPPAAPTGVSAQETGPGCVTVSWQANTEGDLAGYVIYHGAQSITQGAYTDTLDVGNATSGEICSLPTGTRYFAVRAYNAAGQRSDYSAEQAVPVVVPDTTPPNVVLLSPADGATNVSVYSLLGFSLVDNNTGVDSNSVTVRINGVAPAGIRYTGTPARFDVVCRPASMLPPNATVAVVVSVADLASPANTGGRTWSFTTGGIPPATPSGVSAQQTNPGCVTVAWQANTETDLAGYVVYHGAQSVAQGVASTYSDSVDVGTATAREICSLPSGTRYFAVRAYNAAGQRSGYSTEQTVGVVSPDLTGPTVLVVNPQRGETGVVPSTRVQFALIDDSGVDTSNLSVRINGAAPASTSVDGNSNGVVVTCDPAGGLPASSTVVVQVTARDLASPPNTTTDSWTFTTTSVPPAAPTGLSAQGSNTGDAHLAWNANTESNLAGYVIYFGTQSVAFGQAASYPESVTVGPGETSYTVGGLVDDTWYFALRAFNDDNVLSARSGEVSAVVTNGSTQGPLPPQSLQVVENDPGCMSISWHASGEPDVVGYVVYYGPNSVAQGETQLYAVSRDVRNVTVEEICNLTPDTYFVAVRAYNSIGAFSAYSTEKSVSVVGADVVGPVLSLVYPAENSTGVPQNTKVFLLLSDSFSGVDTASVSVTIDGHAPSSMAFTGDPSSRALVCSLANPLPASSAIAVQVSAADLASPANVTAHTWMFTTGDAPDTTPPVIEDHYPPTHASNVSPTTDITIQAWDETGIDPSRVELYVNGRAVEAGVTVVAAGRVTIERSTHDPLAGGDVDVLVVVYDLAGNRQDMSYQFSVGSVAVVAASAEIVPDGYWAEDPSRPLEVRNLPIDWVVHIFTTAGEEVRSFRNTQADGMTWTWDFTNDSGRRVARALYLVRVVDERGSVQHSGRFIVRTSQ